MGFHHISQDGVTGGRGAAVSMHHAVCRLAVGPCCRMGSKVGGNCGEGLVFVSFSQSYITNIGIALTEQAM